MKLDSPATLRQTSTKYATAVRVENCAFDCTAGGAAVLFRPDFVARSSQIHFGICSSLAPRLAEKSRAANVIIFMFMTT